MRYTSLGELMLLEGEEPTRKDWKTWVLEQDMDFNVIHRVPAGFMTDFASIPRIFRGLFTRNGAPWQRAAVIHDYLYSTFPFGTRQMADEDYREQAIIDGTSKLAAGLMYAALRLGGNLLNLLN